MFKVFVNDGSQELPTDDIFYIVAKEGIFLKKKLGVMESIAPVKGISILQSVSTSAKMHIEPIPARSFAKIIDFFKKVFTEYKAEAIVLLYYNENSKKYTIHVPKQSVSAGSVNYEKDISMTGWIKVGDIHSHARMSAFHSGVDSHDEEHSDGLHITIGNLDCEDVSISASIVSNGHRVIVSPKDYISGIEQVGDAELEEKVYTSRVYVHVDGKYKLDDEKSTFTIRKKPNTRYVSVVSPSKSVCNPLWLEMVEPKIYIPTTTQHSFYYDDWTDGNYWNYRNYNGKHYDPHAWNELFSVGNKVPQNKSLLPPTPSSQQQLELPLTQMISDDCDIPCLSCKHKHHKLMIEEESEFESQAFQCMKCNEIIDSDLFEVCPNCHTDEYMIEITAEDITEPVYLDDNHEPTKPIMEVKRMCVACGKESIVLKDNIACPNCGTIFQEFQLMNVKRINDPEIDSTPIDTPSVNEKDLSLRDMFKRIFGKK